MVNLGAYAYPLANAVVVVAGHMGHEQVAAGQAQGVQKFRAPEGFAHDFGFDGRVIVVHDVVGPQQHITLPAFKGAGQWAFGHVGEHANGGVHHHLAVHLAQRGRCEHAVANEVGHKARGRPVVKAVGVFPLVQVPFVHDAYDVANGKGFKLVVRDKERRGPCRLEDGAQLVRQALAQFHVEVGKGLVEQQQARLGCQCACQGHALLLAARELVRVQALGRLQPHQGQHLGHTGLALGSGPAGQAKSHVAAHVQVRKQRVVLEHHANAPELRRLVVRGIAHRVLAQANAARVHTL